MWNRTVVALANPAIIFVVARTCFRSNAAVVLAASVASLNKSTESRVIVKVADDDAEFVTTMLVTTAVVSAGTVYKVALDVAADVLARAFDVVAINYYLLGVV
jgi:hypothetical protein